MVFHDIKTNVDQIWEVVKHNIQETIIVESWTEEDSKAEGQERQIPQKAFIKFFKISFDGASKDNLSPTGLGVLVRNDQGRIINFLWPHMKSRQTMWWST